MQICVDLGIADHNHHHHVWEDKQAAIAEASNELGKHFKPVLHAVWLSYIGQTNQDGAVEAGPAVGEGLLVLDDCFLDDLL